MFQTTEQIKINNKQPDVFWLKKVTLPSAQSKVSASWFEHMVGVALQAFWIFLDVFFNVKRVFQGKTPIFKLLGIIFCPVLEPNTWLHLSKLEAAWGSKVKCSKSRALNWQGTMKFDTSWFLNIWCLKNNVPSNVMVFSCFEKQWTYSKVRSQGLEWFQIEFFGWKNKKSIGCFVMKSPAHSDGLMPATRTQHTFIFSHHLPSQSFAFAALAQGCFTWMCTNVHKRFPTMSHIRTGHQMFSIKGVSPVQQTRMHLETILNPQKWDPETFQWGLRLWATAGVPNKGAKAKLKDLPLNPKDFESVQLESNTTLKSSIASCITSSQVTSYHVMSRDSIQFISPRFMPFIQLINFIYLISSRPSLLSLRWAEIHSRSRWFSRLLD